MEEKLFVARSHVDDLNGAEDVFVKLSDSEIWLTNFLSPLVRMFRFRFAPPERKILESYLTITSNRQPFFAMLIESFSPEYCAEFVQHLPRIPGSARIVASSQHGTEKLYFSFNAENFSGQHSLYIKIIYDDNQPALDDFLDQSASVIDAANLNSFLSMASEENTGPRSFELSGEGHEKNRVRHSEKRSMEAHVHFNTMEEVIERFDLGRQAITLPVEKVTYVMYLEEESFDEGVSTWCSIFPRFRLQLSAKPRDGISLLDRPPSPIERPICLPLFDTLVDSDVRVEVVHDVDHSWIEYIGSDRNQVSEFVESLEIESEFWDGKFEERWNLNRKTASEK